MAQAELEIVTREPDDRVFVLELRGEISRATQGPLLAAWDEASRSGAETVLLNFGQVEGMDSMGLGLLIALVAQAEQRKQRLVACGLSASLQQAFEVSYLKEALPVFPDEAEALRSL